MMHSYYTTHSSFSDPQEYAPLYNSFSHNIAELTQQVKYLFLHYAHLDLFSAVASEEKYAELNLYSRFIFTTSFLLHILFHILHFKLE